MSQFIPLSIASLHYYWITVISPSLCCHQWHVANVKVRWVPAANSCQQPCVPAAGCRSCLVESALRPGCIRVGKWGSIVWSNPLIYGMPQCIQSRRQEHLSVSSTVSHPSGAWSSNPLFSGSMMLPGRHWRTMKPCSTEIQWASAKNSHFY